MSNPSRPALLAVPAVQEARKELSRLASARSNYNIPRPPSEREADYERGVDAFAAAVCQARDAQLAQQKDVLMASIRFVLDGFDKGMFVRSVAHDGESDWAIKFAPYMAALGVLVDAVEKSGGRAVDDSDDPTEDDPNGQCTHGVGFDEDCEACEAEDREERERSTAHAARSTPASTPSEEHKI